MASTQDLFNKCANQLLGTATDRNWAVHLVWILQAPLWSMQYINDRRHLTGDGASQKERLVDVRQNNVEIYHKRSPDSPSHLRSPLIRAMLTLKNIDYGEGLHVGYGISTALS